MENLLNDYVNPDFLRSFELEYYQSQKDGTITDKKKFEYAWCLIRSKFKSDIKKGIDILEDLCLTGDPQAKRDYLFYLSVANTKITDYIRANDCIVQFLSVEPENRQALELQQLIKKKMTRDGLKGVAIASTAALVVGGLIGLGISLRKK